MQKPKSYANKSKLKQLVDPVDKSETIVIEDNMLFCRSCGCEVGARKSLLQQHIKTKKHSDSKGKRLVQQTIGSSVSSDTFGKELCQAFLGADIPIYKLNNPGLIDFLAKYTGKNVPSERMVRRSFIENAYQTRLQEIRDEIQDGPIWVSIDETTDSESRYIANVIVGRMYSDKPSTPYMLNTVHLEKTNNSTIATVFNDSMNLLWPNGVKYNNVFLFVSDGAAYMKLAATNLKALYPRMVHVTCVAHALHRVAEEIRSLYPTVDEFISNVKKVFLKSPSRILTFKEHCPNIPLPPKPVVTRWGTWLEAANYYAEHFNQVKEVIGKLNDEEAVSIRKAKALLQNPELRTQLALIKAHYTFLAVSIDKLQSSNLPLSESLSVLKEVLSKMVSVPDQKVKEKLSSVLTKNPGIKSLTAVANFNAAKLSKISEWKDLSPTELAMFKFAPIVSTAVERSFSVYKSILCDNRRSFRFENLKYHLIVACNAPRSRDS